MFMTIPMRMLIEGRSYVDGFEWVAPPMQERPRRRPAKVEWYARRGPLCFPEEVRAPVVSAGDVAEP
jgi:hypothetical protein